MSAKQYPLMLIIAAMVVSFLLSACAARLNKETNDMAQHKTIRPSSTILFVHGMYMTPDVWEDWQKHFETLGYSTYAPAWPYHGASVDEQNLRHPDEALAQLTLDDVVKKYQDFILTLDEPPIVIGHSMGGLIAQMLLEDGITAGAVAINSAPPKGVLSFKCSFIKANLPHLNLLRSSDKPARLTFKQFEYAFANDMAEDDKHFIYDSYMVPESRKVGRAPLGNSGRINPAVAREPLLFVAGGNDHIIPASLNKSNFQKYRKSPSTTDFIEFSNRNHLTILQPGWINVASYIQDWIKDNQTVASATVSANVQPDKNHHELQADVSF